MDGSPAVNMKFVTAFTSIIQKPSFNDGLIGFATDNPYSGPLMINYLYNADIIQQKVFSIQQAITMDQSPYMVIGSNDPKYSLD